ncbi:MAG: D-alanyl-D-alanine carboxypeptidase [Tissierellia bacterium]|nr:D-alanyl-D-alanine carboxypeptidase [Tissierellia bacterium]
MKRNKIIICLLALLLISSNALASADVKNDNYLIAENKTSEIDVQIESEDEKELEQEDGKSEEVELTPEEIHQRERDRLIKMYEAEPLEKLTTSYLLAEADSGKIVEEYNSDKPLAIASTTKLLSIFVVYDKLADGSISLDDKIIIDEEIARIGGSSYKLKKDEEVTVEELIEAALIVSGNDATVALAKKVAGSEANFVKLMERKLDELDILDAKIINATGLPNYEDDTHNMMSTKSLMILTKELIKKYPEVLEITSKKDLVSESRKFDMDNTNPLLGELSEVDGLKTGYTGKAGRCLVATGIKKGDGVETEDTRLIGIVMGSRGDIERYVASKRLFVDGFKNYKNVIIGNKSVPIDSISSEITYPDTFDIYTTEQDIVFKSGSESLSKEVKLNDIIPPLKAGDKVGTVTYFIDGKDIMTTDVVIEEDLRELNIFMKIQKSFESLFSITWNLFN